MGFFTTPEEDKLLAIDKAGAPKPAKKKPASTMDPTKRGCEHCPLAEFKRRLSTPDMRLYKESKDADILVLGEAPGETEDREGRPFAGESGRMLLKATPARELPRLAYQNMVRCRPPGNETPSPAAVHACSLYLEEDIRKFKPSAILGVGSVPLTRFVPGESILRIHGFRMPAEIAGDIYWYYPVMHPSYIIRNGGSASPAYTQLRNDIKIFFQQVDQWPEPRIYEPDPESVLMPDTLEECQALVDAMSEPIGIDFETTGLNHAAHGFKVLTAGMSDGKTTIAFPVAHPERPTNWSIDFILKVMKSRIWIAHNASYELVCFYFMQALHAKQGEPHPFEDSMALLRLVHERETANGLGLGTRFHLGRDFKSATSVNVKNLINEPLSAVLPYNGLDAQASALLYQRLWKRVKKDAYERLLGVVHSAARMEFEGLPADKEAALALEKQWSDPAGQILAKIKNIYEVKQFERDRQIEFNIASPEHVGEALVRYGKLDLASTADRKKKGGKKTESAAPAKVQYATGEEDLRPYRDDNPLVQAVLEYREATKIVSTYIVPVLEAINNNYDHRLHPRYSTMLTKTLRKSAEDPSIQNFPKRRHREVRRMVCAGPGHVLVAFDYGQLEARVFGMCSQDRALNDSIIRKEDIHSYWRDKALALHPEYYERLVQKTNETEEVKVLKGGRDIIKTDFVFASFFGSDAGACAARTGMPLDITKELLRLFWKRYEASHKWVKGQFQLYNDTGAVSTLTGLTRRGLLPGNEVINTPIQGTAAAIVTDAQARLARRSREEKDPYLHPRINIHDDLTFILPKQEDRLEQYIEQIAEELVQVRFPFQIVPLLVECKVGDNWCDMEEVMTHTGDYLR